MWSPMMQKFDPLLKTAMEEMMAIAQKYNVGAFIDLGSKNYGEFQFIFPSWSLAKFEPQDDGQLGIRIKAKTGVTSHEDFESTVAFILGMIETCNLHLRNMKNVMAMLEKEVEIEHDLTWQLGATLND